MTQAANLAAVGSNANTGGTLITSGTAVTASGTAVDFTGIPSTAKRITVMFNGVSLNGGSNPLIQLGTSSGVTTSGYLAGSNESGTTRAAYTTGFGIVSANLNNLVYGHMVITQITGNSWVSSHNMMLQQSGVYYLITGAGNVTLSSTLDRVRITTVNGTDTFDAGTINIFWE
jgi:hypothetical protein